MVRARAPRTPRKKVQKQRIKPAPPTYQLGLKELQQQPQLQDPSTHCAPRQVVPWPKPSVHRRLAEKSPTPQLVAASDRPMQVHEITSEFMETDVEVVDELSQPPPTRPKPTPTRPGDITSTTDPVPKAAGESNSRTPLILDLSEELVQLNNAHEEVAREAMEHIQRMNSVGIFLESLEIGPLGF